MPEGDTILAIARRLRPVLLGQRLEAITTPQLRHALTGGRKSSAERRSERWTPTASISSSGSTTTSRCIRICVERIDPWRRLSEVTDGELESVVHRARELMLREVDRGGRLSGSEVFEQAGRACPGCRTRIRVRGQWDENRMTYWCPNCQRWPGFL